MSTAEQVPTIREVNLGTEVSFEKLPAPVSVDQDEFFLTQDKAGAYHLLSTICPHSWGTVIDWDTSFMCPDHGWRFERGEGICINGPRSQMYSFTVTVRDGNVYARIPEDKSQWT